MQAILSTAYAFTDRAYIFLDGNHKKKITVILKSKHSREKLDSLINDFNNSLIHYSLREKISKYNKKIREYIISRALYSVIPDFTQDLEQKNRSKNTNLLNANRKKPKERKDNSKV